VSVNRLGPAVADRGCVHQDPHGGELPLFLPALTQTTDDPVIVPDIKVWQALHPPPTPHTFSVSTIHVCVMSQTLLMTETAGSAVKGPGTLRPRVTSQSNKNVKI
jgi:hypothetical protein